MAACDVALDVGVPVKLVCDALSAASLASASLARCASTPVPAARPITAADSRPMMRESINTSVVQPHIVPFLDLLVVSSVTGCAEAGYGEPAGVSLYTPVLWPW